MKTFNLFISNRVYSWENRSTTRGVVVSRHACAFATQLSLPTLSPIYEQPSVE